MKKIRINVLARELEVKSHLIVELLPDLGVSEKVTHSSSIDEDVADKLRVRFGIAPVGNGGRTAESEEHGPAAALESGPQAAPVVEVERPEPPKAAEPPAAAPAMRKPEPAVEAVESDTMEDITPSAHSLDEKGEVRES